MHWIGILAVAAMAVTAGASGRWTEKQAWDWYNKQPWLVGFNFVPSTACNTTEFWQAESFDAKTIDRELALAQGLGFNTCRVFLQYLVWKSDPDGFLKRLDRFLTIASDHGISTTIVLFDDCTFGEPPQTEPVLGKQREPQKGLCLSSWTPSPGHKDVTDKTAWPSLEQYVKAVVGRFGDDKRVLMWDLYNEPGNNGMGDKSLPLVEATFGWARAVKPKQPLTMGCWSGDLTNLNRTQLEISDVVSYHAYMNHDDMKKAIAGYKAHGRPVICTEWMARLLGSNWHTDLPLFKAERVGCCSWGVINGRTQAQYAWWHKTTDPEPEVWFSDLFRKDGTPYDPAETSFIRSMLRGERAALSVDTDKPGHAISPTLYGIFFEEVNCAGDGGLYSELIRNRSFEDGPNPDHWTLWEGNGGKAQMVVVPEQGQHALRVTVESGTVAVVNKGYWGIRLKRLETYELSLCARADGITKFKVSLFGPNVHATGAVAAPTPDWKQFHFTLTSVASVPQAEFAITVEEPGTLWLDMVSLFPKKTFKNRPNGMRQDLAGLLADIKPSFMRFPGGCWVEGDTMEFAQRWKRTIGDLKDRRTQWNLWQYMSTNGLGFHEYLQLCEDLGAEPLFVINVGMSHREVVPMDKMGEYVQDALDAIEYANGPVTSQWGALRAKNGHPKPFGLRRMEIGNENGGPAYQERYALFYDAIKAKHPEVLLVADQPTEKRPADIVDEHYYSNPEFFISNAHRYDNYDRKGPRIYVGEYAVTEGCGNGNLAGALGEAAFMTGMERNSDIVTMASYAPLFANVNHKTWNPDLINFDGSRAYGTPSYWVQQMFSRNRGDVVLPFKLDAPSSSAPEVRKGSIGLGTWNTQAEYKDVRVTHSGKTDQVGFASGWKVFHGDWSAADGVYKQSAAGDDHRSTAGDPSWTDYTLTCKARKLGGAEGFLIMFHVRDDKNWLWWNIGGWGNTRHAIEWCRGGSKSVVGPDSPGSVETGRWYDVRIELSGEHIRCYLDGKLVHDATYPPPPSPMYAVASRITATGEVILKLVNVSEFDRDTLLTVPGLRSPTTGTAIVLTGNPDDENSLDNPTHVSPKIHAVSPAGPSLHFTFPAHSVTVLRLGGKR